MADETALANLKKERAKIRAALTRFSTFIKNPANQRDKVNIRQRLDDTKSLLSKFIDIQIEIEEVANETTNEIETFENLYYQEITYANNLLGDLLEHAPRSNTATPTVNNDINASNNFSVRLPKIELMCFDGSFDKWLEFHDYFQSVVHTNQGLHKVQKLQYLKSCLKEEAAAVVSSLESTAENYDIAWNLLRERFDNRRLIIQNHLKSIINLPSMAKESCAELRVFIDKLRTHLRALKTLEENVEQWDTLLIQIITPKLDRNTHTEWEKSLTDTSMPTWDKFIKFLEQRCIILQSTLINVKSINNTNVNNKFNSSQKRQTLTTTNASVVCAICQGSHKIFMCNVFKSMTVSERADKIKSLQLCFNCFRSGHRNIECTSECCKKCDKRHNTLLHYESKNPKFNQNLTTRVVKPNESKNEENNTQSKNVHTSNHSNVNLCALASTAPTQILLSTAIVEFEGKNNERVRAKIVLDSGSQSNFVTQRLAYLLKLRQNKLNIPIEGLNQLETCIRESVHTTIHSLYTKYSSELEFLIVPKICAKLPIQPFSKNSLNLQSHIKLADPEYFKPSEIDALIGAEIFYDLLCGDQFSVGGTKITKTKLGWIIGGRIISENARVDKKQCLLSLDAIHHKITKFWEIEEINTQKFLSEDEAKAEAHFQLNTRRDADSGRFIVRLPFNNKINNLGETFHIAKQRFLNLEKKLNSNSELKKQYLAFIREYIELGHMHEVSETPKKQCYYMPHHAVIKESSQTTRVRVVFDASAKSSTGISLNNCLLSGPTIQQDIFSIVSRFRTHQIVLTADIEKMYRQILVDSRDAPYQQLLHRENSDESLKIYRANTVTYGTTSAPFLAIRTLFQLADEVKREFPITAEIIKRDFYVDDILTGAETIESATKLRDELIRILKSAGFILRKWTSNVNSLIQSLPREISNVDLLAKNELQGALGIHWDPKLDIIKYRVKDTDHQKVTKRNILSSIAQLYDPIGLLGPVIVVAKILMQDLWKCELSWDETVPSNIASRWSELNSELKGLEEFSISRKTIIRDADRIEIHGFCDASEKAYGACLYIRSSNPDKEVYTNLLCSKNRVAPLKSVTLPKLELCGALLLVRLLNSIREILHKPIDEIYLWTDSTITIQWIRTQPYLLQTFVANRVSEIQNTINSDCWRHVPSKDNPADFLSRGQKVSEFVNNAQWKYGPNWLKKDKSQWPTKQFESTPMIEVKSKVTLTCSVQSQEFLNLINKTSSLYRLKRIFGYIWRFIHNIKKNNVKLKGKLTIEELNNAMNFIIKLTQRECFKNEINLLKQGKNVLPSSDLRALNPFLDKNEIIRVGGRLNKSNIPHDAKHPIVLPKNHHLTILIIRNVHSRQLHSGAQTTLYAVRQNYWPLSGKNTTKGVIKKCVICFRAKPKEPDYIMGNLPRDRVTMARPFLNVGVDFCGPFFMKEKKFRNRKKVKIYSAIFVCFVTKAIHIELVTDLTSEAFLACLRRFFARRGRAINIYSDNATNFTGAFNEIKDLINDIESERAEISNFLTENRIKWHFIPARSPHFGGLWEAGVKSFKNLFVRTVGDALFTYEELLTYVTEIEAILNSRPLIPLSDDPNDLNALCPSHFLIGDTLTSLPEYDLTDVKINRLSLWQHIQVVKQHFWNRWSKEYLNELNTRSKWQFQRAEKIKLGTLVLLKDDNLPPLRWSLGRIIEIHPGDDGIIRAVTVKDKNGIYKRAIKLISPLPINTEDNN